MTMPIRRRIGTSIAALALVVGLASGCTAGDWRYDAPPAAGVQQDAGPVKVRNLMVLTDGAGQGLLLGSVFTSEPLDLTQVALSAEQADGSFGPPVPLQISGKVPVESGLMLGEKDSSVEGTDLDPSRLVNVLLVFSNGTTMMLEAPVMSAEHPDYEAAWDKAQS